MIEPVDQTFYSLIPIIIPVSMLIGALMIRLDGIRPFIIGTLFGVGFVFAMIFLVVQPLENEYQDAVQNEIINADCEELERLFNYYNSTKLETQIQKKYKADCIGIPEEPWWE